MKNNRISKVHYSKFLFIFGSLLFCIIIVRLIYLNVSTKIDGIDLKDFANNRNTTKETLYAVRGSIYDMHGEVLAQTIDSYTVVAYLNKSRSKNSKKPLHVVDKEMTAEKLSPILKMSKEKILDLLNQKDLYQVELGPGGKGLTELQKDAIKKLKFPGIDFIASSKRYYPNMDSASYTLGYVTTDAPGKITGEMGIEGKYNEELTGTNGSLEYQKDANGYKLINGGEIKIGKIDGNDVYVKIDGNVQLMAERVLKKAYEESGAKSALLVVAEAKTGKVVASVSEPSFDPNIKNITNYMDPLVSIAFEPGSTMKTYAYMAAIEKGNYNGDQTYESGTMKIDEYTIKDWNTYGWGVVSYDYGYRQSSNIGVTKMVQEYLSKDELLNMYKNLGFGSKTGIELPNEATGEVKFKYDIEVANASFGQGIKTTPIQHIKALTAISNNGYVLNPTVIEKIVDTNTNKTVYKYKKQNGSRLIKESTVNKIKSLMDTVVNTEDGTGSMYHMDGYDIIGKTGTAQVYNASKGDYYKSTEASIKSFEGMYPKNDPKYVFYIAVENSPGNPMPDAVKSLITEIETYYNLSKEGENVNSTFKIGNYLNKKTQDVKSILDANGIKYDVIGNGDKIINQYPQNGFIVNGRVFLLTNDPNKTVPDINGISSKDLVSLCKLLNIELNQNGQGYVVNYTVENNEQNIPIKINANLDQKYKGNY